MTTTPTTSEAAGITKTGVEITGLETIAATAVRIGFDDFLVNTTVGVAIRAISSRPITGRVIRASPTR